MVIIRRIKNAYPRILFASITLQGTGLTSVHFVNIPFLITKRWFLLLNHHSMQVVDTNLQHIENINIEPRCLEEAWNFQRF